jgi:hypothetical protein
MTIRLVGDLLGTHLEVKGELVVTAGKRNKTFHAIVSAFVMMTGWEYPS